MIGVSTFAYGAAVKWDCMSITSTRGENGISVGCYDFAHPQMIWPEIGFEISVQNQVILFAVVSDYVVAEFIGNWVVAKPGDVACEETTRHLNNYLYHSYMDNSYHLPGMEAVIGTDDGPVTHSGSVSVKKGLDVYLMFAVESIGILDGNAPEIYYGWTQLLTSTDGSVRVGASAIDLDGGPMIVGGGSAIPEPSSTLLLLIGGALLALKRQTSSSPRTLPWQNAIA